MGALPASSELGGSAGYLSHERNGKHKDGAQGRRVLRLTQTLLLTAFAFAGAVGAVLGAPSMGDEHWLRQPDGELARVRIWGDEFFQHVESPDGYTLVRDPATGVICYAQLSAAGDELISTGVRVGSRDPGGLSLAKGLWLTPKVRREKAQRARRAMEAKSPARAGAKQFGVTTGTKLGVCILIDFEDEPATIPPGEIQRLFTEPGYSGYNNTESVRDYYLKVSEGLLDCLVDVVPYYYRALHPKTYYDNPLGSAAELIQEAAAELGQKGFPFADYDDDGDGLLDYLHVLYAGQRAAGWAEGLWPHRGWISVDLGAVRTSNYEITDITIYPGIRTITHESGHMIMDWPDLYDYGFESAGVGAYCLMASGYWPSAYLRLGSGWAQALVLDAPATGLSLTAGNDTVYEFPHPTEATEYYLLENLQRNPNGQFLPDTGIAVWHVDENGSNDYEDMTPSSHYKVTLVQADGEWDLERGGNSGDGTDLWSAPDDVCGAFTAATTDWWDGSLSGALFYDISASSDTMTFSFDWRFEPTLAEALDWDRTVWATGPTQSWTGQTTETVDGLDAAQCSAEGGMGTTSTLSATFRGEGELVFFWKVSSLAGGNNLGVYIDGALVDSISGDVAWTSVTVPIPVGLHTVEWSYVRDTVTTAGQDLGWVDQVVYYYSIAESLDRPTDDVVGDYLPAYAGARSWIGEGEMIWNHSGVMTDLEEPDVAHVMRAAQLDYCQAVWRLYDMKMAMETHYQDLLSDLNLHHPPCNEIVRNAGFYAVATPAHTLARGVDLIGGRSAERGSSARKDGGRRKRPRPRRMRLWRLRRKFFSLPGRIAQHGRVLKITLLGLREALRREFEQIFQTICRC